MGKEWYDEHHKNKETPKLLSWFINFYGKSDDYEDIESEQDEYWIRRGFALMGWIAAKEDNKKA